MSVSPFRRLPPSFVVEAAQSSLRLLSKQRQSVRWQIPLGLAVIAVQCLWFPWKWVWIVWAVGVAFGILTLVLVERKYPEREERWTRARDAHAEIPASHRVE